MFEGKICVITGGALGIGRCLVQEFARVGARVAFVDCNDAEGKRTQASAPQSFFFCGDIAKKETLEQFVAEIAQRFGRVDFLIHNACISKRGLHSNCGYEDFDEVLRVGITAPYYLTKLCMPHFAPDACVVNISSTRAFQSQADTESYSAAKGGISALTHAMAASLSGKVRVNAIAPGWIDTGAYYDENYCSAYTGADEAQHFSGRVGVPMDIFRAAAFLCDTRNSFVNAQTIVVDGGMSRKMIYADDEGWSLLTE